MNYRSIDGGCYYIQTEKQASFETAQADCDTRFPNGGHLFEPQCLTIAEKVGAATLEVYPHAYAYYIGLKRETVGSDFKLVSSGKTVPYEINWKYNLYPIGDASYSCGFVATFVATSQSGFKWLNDRCDYEAYSICESATTPAGMKL